MLRVRVTPTGEVQCSPFAAVITFLYPEEVVCIQFLFPLHTCCIFQVLFVFNVACQSYSFPHFWNLHHIQTKCINSVLLFLTSCRCEPHGTYRCPGTLFTFSLQGFAEEEQKITALVIFTSRGDNTLFSPLPALRHHSCSSHPAPPGPAAAGVEPTPPLLGASPPP